MSDHTIHFHHSGNCGCGCGGHNDGADDGTRRWDEVADDEVVCHCAKVTKGDIVKAIRNGAYTVPLLKILTGVGRGRPCPNDNRCVQDLGKLLNLYGQTTLSDALIDLEED